MALVLVPVWMAGCAPVISKSLIKASEPKVVFEQLRSAPTEHLGKTVVLGGTVISVRHEDTGTVVEILQRPLGWRLRPELNDETGGRFLARFGKVVPETSLERHRRITLAGTVMDQETRPLDQTTYTYPVIRVEEYHLWPVPPKGPPRFTIGFGVSGTL